MFCQAQKAVMLPAFDERKSRGGLRGERDCDTLLKNTEIILFCVDERGKKCYNFRQK